MPNFQFVPRLQMQEKETNDVSILFAYHFGMAGPLPDWLDQRRFVFQALKIIIS